MRQDPLRALIGAPGLGRDVACQTERSAPPARTDKAHRKTLRRLMARYLGLDSVDLAPAEFDG